MSAQPATAMQPMRGAVPVRQSSGDLIEQFDRIYESIGRRAFEIFQNNGQWFGHDLDDWLRAEAEVLHPVHMDLTESDTEFTVRAEVPGFSAKELDIRVEPRSLRIAGKREHKEEGNGQKIRSERCADQILRAVDFPADVDTTRASAIVKDGVLTIDLPKATHAKAIRIEPKSA